MNIQLFSESEEIPRLSLDTFDQLLLNKYIPPLSELQFLLQSPVCFTSENYSTLERDVLEDILTERGYESLSMYQPFLQNKSSKYILESANRNIVISAICATSLDNIVKNTYSDLLMVAIQNSIDSVGIILPLQEQIFILSISNWDFIPMIMAHVERRNKIYSVGSHFGQKGSGVIYKSYLKPENINSLAEAKSFFGRLECFASGFGNRNNKISNSSLPACQMMIRGNLGGKYSLTDVQINKAKSTILRLNIPYFTHSPYNINLGRPLNLKLLEHDLNVTRKIGGRGVVVHCGKTKELSIDKALKNQKQSIEKCFNLATEFCPILLETSTGMGTELLWRFEEMSEFFDSFNGDKRLKLCIDTAHVHGAGYIPKDYIEMWIEKHGSESIGLVHLNDSEVKRSSRLDRHERIGKGYIGFNQLLEVIEICLKHGIHMVHE